MKKTEAEAFRDFMLAEAMKYGREIAPAEIDLWFETFGRSTLEEFKVAWESRKDDERGAKWFPKITELQVILKKGAARAKQADWRCSEEVNGQHCNFPGGISPSLHGGGPWYCAPHFALKGTLRYSPEASLQIIERSQSYQRPKSLEEIYAAGDRRRAASKAISEKKKKQIAEEMARVTAKLTGATPKTEEAA